MKKTGKKVKYILDASNFAKISGTPIAYWVSDQMYHSFELPKISSIADVRSGMTTTDNNRFLRLWHEISFANIGFHYEKIDDTEDDKFKWFPFCKGGDYRKWYGNQEYVVNWYSNGVEIRKAAEGASGGRLVNVDIAMGKCLVWTKISSGSIAFRDKSSGIFFSDAAPGVFSSPTSQTYLLGLLNTKFAQEVIDIINPTLNYVPGAVAGVPYNGEREESVNPIVEENIRQCKTDWDAFETSWDFKKHPLI